MTRHEVTITLYTEDDAPRVAHMNVSEDELTFLLRLASAFEFYFNIEVHD